MIKITFSSIVIANKNVGKIGKYSTDKFLTGFATLPMCLYQVRMLLRTA